MAKTEREAPKPAIQVLIGPQNRTEYLDQLLKLDGLDGLQEDENAAYCALSLTNTPQVAKEFVKSRQTVLRNVLSSAGITSYDPGSSPLSPDINLSAGPAEIYKTDLARVAGARFFTAFDTFPSTGVGVEVEAARRYNRIPVIFHDDAIRTSRMQPDCAIHISIRDLDEQKEEVVAMFDLLKEYEPGRGLVDDQPALLGFKNGEAVHLTGLVHKEFPQLVYTFDGTKPALLFGMENSSVLIKE